MLLFLLIALVGSAVSSPILEVEPRSATNEELAAMYNLPRTVRPTSYDVILFLDPGNPANFTGSVTIRIVPTVSTSEIVLHAMAMEINTIGVWSDRDAQTDLVQDYHHTQNDTHFLRIWTTQALTADVPYNIHITYTGTYASNMFGIYVSTYEEPGVGTV